MKTTPSDAVTETLAKDNPDLFVDPNPTQAFNPVHAKKTRKPRSKSKYVAIKAEELEKFACANGSSIKDVEGKLGKVKTTGDMVILCIRRELAGTVEEVYTLKAKRE